MHKEITMSNPLSQQTTTATGHQRGPARVSTETKAAFKTTEFIAYVVAVVAVLIAAAVVNDSNFGAHDAWLYVTLLTIGYMISRGLAKSGSRDFYDADRDDTLR